MIGTETKKEMITEKMIAMNKEQLNAAMESQKITARNTAAMYSAR